MPGGIYIKPHLRLPKKLFRLRGQPEAFVGTPTAVAILPVKTPNQSRHVAIRMPHCLMRYSIERIAGQVWRKNWLMIHSSTCYMNYLVMKDAKQSICSLNYLIYTEYEL